MRLRIDKSKILPKQDLRGTTGLVARIIKVFPLRVFETNNLGEKVKTTYKNADTVGIVIRDRGKTKNSLIIYTLADFEEFKRNYGIKRPHALKNKPVVSVYEKSQKDLIGLIPLEEKELKCYLEKNQTE